MRQFSNSQGRLHVLPVGDVVSVQSEALLQNVRTNQKTRSLNRKFGFCGVPRRLFKIMALTITEDWVRERVQLKHSNLGKFTLCIVRRSNIQSIVCEKVKFHKLAALK